MANQSPAEFIENFNRQYEAKHKSYENNFWATKMNLNGCSTQQEVQTKTELDQFLGDKAMLLKVQEYLKTDLPPSERKTLLCFERVFKCYIIQDAAALELKNKMDAIEAELAVERGKMNLGYTLNGVFTKMSSVQLRNTMQNNEDENVRKACWEGLRSIGPLVTKKFCQMVNLRNKFAKIQGFECYYDMKVTQAEGFNKMKLFEIMDDLEAKSAPILKSALAKLEKEKGKNAVLPYNTDYYMAGDVTKLQDPYFPFENAVDSWARSYAAMAIDYKGAEMQLDLVDRDGKYSNGFCHWPQPAWMSPEGWVPSRTNFTSLATPSAIGSGETALVTLMHEGGHAAHFANVVQESPLYSQERAPTSVAYAENQSMFLDSLVGDSAWLARYALSRKGKAMPWDLIEKKIRDKHEYEVIGLRSMLAVPYFEKAVYELPEHEVTPERLLKLADETEIKIQGVLGRRPLFAVPHILSDESSCYYHGYVLADMSVHHTRAHFLKTYGTIVDNPKIGADLTNYYWKAGNSEIFLDLVQNLTGKPLTCDAWIQDLLVSTEDLVKSERVEYDEALKKGPTYKPGDAVDLKMKVTFVHGDLVICDSDSNGKGLSGACEIYKKWVAQGKF
jgi:oligoendopeptidase F